MDANFQEQLTPPKRRSFPRFNFSLRKLRSFKSSLYLPLAAIVIVIAILGILALRKSSQITSVQSSSNSQLEVKDARASEKVDKTYSFPLKDEAGKTVSTISYTIQTAELRDQIIVKGETATAVKGRTFLILNIKLTNNFTKAVQINARDYIRLSVDGSSEKLAADIHNDPVEVQAISTKFTRIGFPIDDNKKKMTLQIGEIQGTKQTVNLSF